MSHGNIHKGRHAKCVGEGWVGQSVTLGHKRVTEGGGGLNRSKFLIERYFFKIFKIFELSTHAKAIIKSFFKITQLRNFLMPF